MPLADALTGVCDWYAARGLPPMVAVPYPLGRPGDSDLDRFLDRRGWGTRPGPAIVMTAATAGVARSGPAGEAELRPEPDQAWLGLYHGYRGGNCHRSPGGCCSRRRSRRSPASGATAAPSPSAGSRSRAAGAG